MDIATAFAALGDAGRLAMIQVLYAHGGNVCVFELRDRLHAYGFRYSQPTVSHHLRILRHAGLISVVQPRGTFTYYALDTARFAEVQAYLGQFVREAALV